MTDAKTAQPAEPDSSPDVSTENLNLEAEFKDTIMPEEKEDIVEDLNPSEPAEQNTDKLTEPEPFHKHPRFQELNQTAKNATKLAEEYKGKLETVTGELEQIKQYLTQQAQAKREPEVKSKYDWNSLSDDEINTLLFEKPKDFLGALLNTTLQQAIQQNSAIVDQRFQQISEAQKAENAQKTEQGRIENAEKYFKEDEKALEALESGKLATFLQNNPHIDPKYPVKAYEAMVAFEQSSEDHINALVEERVKEALAKQGLKPGKGMAPTGNGVGSPGSGKKQNNSGSSLDAELAAIFASAQ